MPSITDGLFSGRSGIQSHGIAISVLADNIANQNTTGYKFSRPDFADVLSGSLGGGSSVQIGSGSSVSVITQILTQGSFEQTGRGLDTGIEGKGFFVVEGGSGQRLYSRAGNFAVNTEGFLTDQSGQRVLGFPEGGTGSLEPLSLNTVSQDNVSTTRVSINGNLDASASLSTVVDLSTNGTGVTFSDLNEASNFSTFVDVFDSLGAKHTLTTFFYRTGQNEWEAQLVVDQSEINDTTTTLDDNAGFPFELGTVTLDFNSDGTRTGGAPVAPNFDIDLTDAADDITWANGATPGAMGITFTDLTQFSTPSSVSSISQNGTGTGSVIDFSISSDGTLTADLSNGNQASIGVVALATFANGEGLRRVGGSTFTASNNSGAPVIGQPGSGNFGTLQSGALEQSTADLASDFIKLISLQRGFQGSSRIITNIDDLLNEIINLA